MTPEELEEVVIQTVPCAGFPTVINALALMHEVVAERTAERATVTTE